MNNDVNNTKWPVVPLCDNQLKDIRETDVLNNGLYRLCDIYRGGGGYDKFIHIYNKRFNTDITDGTQFVVQLYGCPLRCPYCYVTRQGVTSNPVWIHEAEILKAFYESGAPVFHLMGGAPAIYLQYWKGIGNKVPIFHSDFLCVESVYNDDYLYDLPGLHALSLKDRYIYTDNQWDRIRINIDKLVKCNVNFYVTFTGESMEAKELIETYYPDLMEDSFTIPIMDYEAIH